VFTDQIFVVAKVECSETVSMLTNLGIDARGIHGEANRIILVRTISEIVPSIEERTDYMALLQDISRSANCWTRAIIQTVLSESGFIAKKNKELAVLIESAMINANEEGTSATVRAKCALDDDADSIVNWREAERNGDRLAGQFSLIFALLKYFQNLLTRFISRLTNLAGLLFTADVRRELNPPRFLFIGSIESCAPPSSRCV
jgi:hypothetical protein